MGSSGKLTAALEHLKEKCSWYEEDLDGDPLFRRHNRNKKGRRQARLWRARARRAVYRAFQLETRKGLGSRDPRAACFFWAEKLMGRTDRMLFVVACQLRRGDRWDDKGRKIAPFVGRVVEKKWPKFRLPEFLAMPPEFIGGDE